MTFHHASIDEFRENSDTFLWAYYTLMMEKISEAHRDGLGMATICTVYFHDYNFELLFESDRVDWETHLGTALAHFEKVEAYVQCAAVRDLIKEVKRG